VQCRRCGKTDKLYAGRPRADRIKNSGRFSPRIREQGVARTHSPGNLSRGPQPA